MVTNVNPKKGKKKKKSFEFYQAGEVGMDSYRQDNLQESQIQEVKDKRHDHKCPDSHRQIRND